MFCLFHSSILVTFCVYNRLHSLQHHECLQEETSYSMHHYPHLYDSLHLAPLYDGRLSISLLSVATFAFSHEET